MHFSLLYVLVVKKPLIEAHNKLIGVFIFSWSINVFSYSIDAIKVLEDGDLQTLGMLDYDKRLEHAFTAHPKVDPVTGKNNAILVLI